MTKINIYLNCFIYKHKNTFYVLWFSLFFFYQLFIFFSFLEIELSFFDYHISSDFLVYKKKEEIKAPRKTIEDILFDTYLYNNKDAITKSVMDDVQHEEIMSYFDFLGEYPREGAFTHFILGYDMVPPEWYDSYCPITFVDEDFDERYVDYCDLHNVYELNFSSSFSSMFEDLSNYNLTPMINVVSSILYNGLWYRATGFFHLGYLLVEDLILYVYDYLFSQKINSVACFIKPTLIPLFSRMHYNGLTYSYYSYLGLFFYFAKQQIFNVNEIIYFTNKFLYTSINHGYLEPYLYMFNFSNRDMYKINLDMDALYEFLFYSERILNNSLKPSFYFSNLKFFFDFSLSNLVGGRFSTFHNSYHLSSTYLDFKNFAPWFFNKSDNFRTGIAAIGESMEEFHYESIYNFFKGILDKSFFLSNENFSTSPNSLFYLITARDTNLLNSLSWFEENAKDLKVHFLNNDSYLTTIRDLLLEGIKEANRLLDPFKNYSSHFFYKKILCYYSFFYTSYKFIVMYISEFKYVKAYLILLNFLNSSHIEFQTTIEYLIGYEIPGVVTIEPITILKTIIKAIVSYIYWTYVELIFTITVYTLIGKAAIYMFLFVIGTVITFFIYLIDNFCSYTGIGELSNLRKDLSYFFSKGFWEKEWSRSIFTIYTYCLIKFYLFIEGIEANMYKHQYVRKFKHAVVFFLMDLEEFSPWFAKRYWRYAWIDFTYFIRWTTIYYYIVLSGTFGKTFQPIVTVYNTWLSVLVNFFSDIYFYLYLHSLSFIEYMNYLVNFVVKHFKAWVHIYSLFISFIIKFFKK